MRFTKRLAAFTRILCLLSVVVWTFGGPAIAADVTWDGDTDGVWSTATNWIGDAAPPAATGDTAIFDGAGGLATTIDLSGAASVDRINFNSATAAAFTIGAGAVGTDTLTLSDNDNAPNVFMSGSVVNDQTINANILLGPDAVVDDTAFANRSTTNKLIINGNIDTATGGTAGIKRLEFGELSSVLNVGTEIDVNGDVSNAGGATRIDMLVGGGTTLNLSGVIDQTNTNNTVRARTIVLDSSTINVNAAGKLGRGQFDVRQGTVNLNNIGSAQDFNGNINMGSATQSGSGDSAIVIAGGATVNLSSGLNYLASNTNANLATVSGGTLNLTSNRTVNVADNALVAGAELTISSDTSSDNTSRTLTKVGAGTLLLSSASIGHGHINAQNGLTQLLVDDAWNTINRDLTVQNQNAASGITPNVEFDLNGADAQIDDLFLGNVITDVSGGGGTVSVTNSDFATNGGTLRLDGNLFYRDGTRIELDFTGENAGGTKDLAVNQQVTGGTSGATGFIEGIRRSGTTGTISIRNLGAIPFVAGETITTVTGAGTAGVDPGTATAVAAAVDVGTTKLNGGATVSANLNLVNSNSVWTIDDGADAVDLLVSGDISADTTGRNITIRGEGTVQLDGSNTHNRTILENQMTILGSGDALGIGGTAGALINAGGIDAAAGEEARVYLRQRNVLRFPANGDEQYNGAVALDINGQEVVFAENLEIGAATNNIDAADVAGINVLDSVGTGKLVLGGLNAQFDNNNITFQAGSAGKLNKTATISADIEIRNSSSTFTVNDGADDVDLLVSGDISADTGGRGLSKSNGGTLYLTGTNNTPNAGIDILTINNGTVRIDSDANLGDNDVILGTNTNNGTLEYVGTGETINNQFRIGDNNATAGTRTGGGVITNNGTGTITFSQGAFNQIRNLAATNRTITLDGTSDIVITGAIIDNVAVTATLGIEKNGTNTATLAGTSTYTGDTNINVGRLDLTGSLTSNVFVAVGATIGGEGSTTGSLTFAAGATTLEMDASTLSALSSSGLTTTGSTVTVNVAGIAPAPITVIDYSTAAGVSHRDGVDGVCTRNRGDQWSGSRWLSDTGTAITLDLGFATRTWDNNNGGGPNSGTGPWIDGNTADNNWLQDDEDFFNGDSVTFDDTPGAAQTITLGSNVAPGSISFANGATTAYTINDNGGGETITIDSSLNYSSSANSTINAVIAGSGLGSKVTWATAPSTTLS